MSVEPSSELPPLGQSLSASSGLGSLAQSIRLKELKTARNILVIVGLLWGAFGLFFFFNTHNEVEQLVRQQVQDLHARGMAEIPASVEQFRHRVTLFCQMIYGGQVVLGAVLIVLGALVRRHPVPTTVLGLVLYVGYVAIFGLLNPASLLSGLLFKIIVVVALAKSIQSAVAYQRSR